MKSNFLKLLIRKLELKMANDIANLLLGKNVKNSIINMIKSGIKEE